MNQLRLYKMIISICLLALYEDKPFEFICHRGRRATEERGARKNSALKHLLVKSLKLP